ncbi:uncharacterized protein LOC107810361 isoform X2 [Nicotiana tabacum]|uniref:Uncharacterized protein LOC107810361 isoform X2 n=2 Tax=Nicotiana TaxID=4085 RepID=A0A1S4BP16_TOBAC|nr:PREDICTED: uncharacterized protein LOC104248031 isoform X2 [Nicotiana sylvestris]XP_016490614.1 PREDICTED: uncharacterized protein LOC107810361 isoform X2 [Nicotiana tabacum]
MEGLRKLENVQKIIQIMQSHGIISNTQNATSLRFLADLTLLLVSPCHELDVDAKCQLIIDHVPKFSHVFFEETMQCISEQGVEQMVNTGPLDCDDKTIPAPSQKGFKDTAMIELDAMGRANSTLEDFCRSYFMFHKMDPHQPQSIFKYLPILSFTESYIYQLDNLNEKLLQPSVGKDQSSYRGYSVETKEDWDLTSVRMMTNDPFRPLCNVLEHHGLLTDRIREEMKSGVEYWSLERKLCHPLGSKHEVDDMHMEFLSISEFLVEVSDDLFDYEDDVLENNFNILRMFNRIYGASAAPAMLAKIITEAEEKYDSLLKALDPELSLNYQKRCEEATKEGGKTSGPSLGTWTIPPIIEDEDLYRSDVLNSKPSTIPEWTT